MSTLRLIGAACDEPSLKRLADALRKANFSCVIDVGTPTSTAVSKLEQCADSAVLPEPIFEIFLWTQTSVSDEWADFRARAKRPSEGASYILLLLNDVEAPDFASSEHVFRVVLQAPADDQSALASFAKWLRNRDQVSNNEVTTAVSADFEVKSSQTPKTVRDIFAKLLNIWKLLKFGAIGVILVGFTSAYGFFADIIGTQDKICSWSWMYAICSKHGWGNLPTNAERFEWESQKDGDDCGFFRKIYARGGYFADEAKRRFDTAEYTDGSDTDRFPLLVPYTEPPLQTESMARADILTRANSLASEMCALHAQNFVKEDVPGRFEPKGDIKCEARGGDHACTIDGVAVCTFVKKNIIEKCPSASRSGVVSAVRKASPEPRGG